MALISGRFSLSAASACRRARLSHPWISIEFFQQNTHRFLSTAAATKNPLDGDAPSSSPFRDYQEQRWESNFQQVLDKLSSGADVTEVYLKRWISRQRVEYSKRMKGAGSRLHDTRLLKLLILEENFQILQSERHVWEKSYARLVQFINDHHGMFPYDVNKETLSPDDMNLLEWCARQRSAKRLDGSPADRLERLKAVGFAFSVSDIRWSQRYQEIVQFRKEHGHAMVPNRYKKNPGLARWVLRQREGEVSDDRSKLLLAVDFVFEPCEFRWLTKYYELKDFMTKNGKGALLRGQRNRKYSALRRWFKYQKACYRNYMQGEVSSMTERRKELLQELGFHFEFGEAIDNQDN